MHRICVIGPPGSGKTTLAQELARRLGIRYLDFDATVLLPHWERVPREQRMAVFEPLTRDGDWVTDGHLRSGRDWEQLILARADTVIWLDLPRWQTMVSVTLRTLWNTVMRRPAFGGNVETFSMLWSPEHSIVLGWTMYEPLRREYIGLFSDPANRGKALLRFTSRRTLRRWLREL